MPRAEAMTASPDKPRAILDAALALFAERGCAATPMPAIAEAACVGAGTIYRHFDSKEALVNAVFRDAKALLADALLAEPDVFRDDAPVRRRFDALWRALARFARTQPLAFRFLELQDHHAWLDDQSRALGRALLEPIHAAVLAHQQRGALRRDLGPEATIALVWGALVGLVKAERLGYLALDDATLEAAGLACWAACRDPDAPTEH